MKAIIEPGYLTGTIAAPPSKSMTQRAFAAALLHKGKTVIRGAGSSLDELAALNIIQQLGATVSASGNLIEVVSNGINPNGSEIFCGESGLSARLFTPIAALSKSDITIHGEGTLLRRPLGDVNILKELGATISEFNGKLPITVRGPLKPQSTNIDARDSSQLVSGLLFALSYATAEPITITVTNLKSRPYIDMTLDMLARFGKPVSHHRYHKFHIDPSAFCPSDTVEVDVEGDWSSAAFFMVAGAIAGEVTVTNLNLQSKQADTAILTLLQTAGAYVQTAGNAVAIRSQALTGFEFDATHCPDLFPVLAILAACCEGESHITGIHRLFHKESNRVESIAEMLWAFNVHFSIESDILSISGEGKLQPACVDSYQDHRIAMAAAIGSLRATGQVTINDAEAVNKSYPAFFKDLSLCGIACSLSEQNEPS